MRQDGLERSDRGSFICRGLCGFLKTKGGMAVSDYVLSCESTVDLTQGHLTGRETPYICYSYELDGVPHRDDLWQTISSAEFYRKMAEGADYAENCYICHSACEADAWQVAELVEVRFPNLKNRVEIYSIGPTIGSHTGPGTVALFFWGSPRTD